MPAISTPEEAEAWAREYAERRPTSHLGRVLGLLVADLDERRRTVTTGGKPPPCDQDWANEDLAPPPSASDPNAPAHRRGRVSDQQGGDAG